VPWAIECKIMTCFEVTEKIIDQSGTKEKTEEYGWMNLRLDINHIRVTSIFFTVIRQFVENYVKYIEETLRR
jgi:hypothetical protein